jgi:hypothetical protein
MLTAPCAGRSSRIPGRIQPRCRRHRFLRRSVFLSSLHSAILRQISVSLVDGYNLPCVPYLVPHPFPILTLVFTSSVRIDNTAGCPIPKCAVDLGPNCKFPYYTQPVFRFTYSTFNTGPASLKGPFDSTGFPVGCKSACLVDALNGRAANSPNCCSGSFNTPQTCPSSGVQFYSYFSQSNFHSSSQFRLHQTIRLIFIICPTEQNCPAAYAYAYDDLTSLFTCPSSANAGYTISFCPAS